MKKQNIRTLALIVCTFSYLLVGAGIFQALEANFENDECDRLKKEQDQLCGKYNITEKDFRDITMIVMRSEPHRAGIQWKFTGAFYFATTVITTIGYGHSTPKTAAGKIFCMLYAMAGIPLNLVMFQSLGERLNIFTTYLIRLVKKCFRFRKSDVSQTLLILISTQMSAVVVFGGAWTFSHYEAWSYLDSFYYCVITLTTVGFGDYVALQKNQTLQNQLEYVAFGIFFILFGLTVVSAAMNLLVLRFLTMNTVDERRDEQLAAIRRSTIQLASGVMAINGGGMLPMGAMLPPGNALAIKAPVQQNNKVSRATAASIATTTFVAQSPEKSRLTLPSFRPTSCLCCSLWFHRQEKLRYRVTRPPVGKVERLLELGVSSEMSSLCGSTTVIDRRPKTTTRQVSFSQQHQLRVQIDERTIRPHMKHVFLERSSSAERATRHSF